MYSAHSSESKAQLLQRVSSLLQMELESLQDLINGAGFVQMLDVYFPDEVPIQKVDFLAHTYEQAMPNYKVLQLVFDRIGIGRDVDIQKLLRGHQGTLLELLQWLCKYLDGKEPAKHYDPAARRASSKNGNCSRMPAFGASKEAFRRWKMREDKIKHMGGEWQPSSRNVMRQFATHKPQTLRPTQQHMRPSKEERTSPSTAPANRASPGKSSNGYRRPPVAELAAPMQVAADACQMIRSSCGTLAKVARQLRKGDLNFCIARGCVRSLQDVLVTLMRHVSLLLKDIVLRLDFWNDLHDSQWRIRADKLLRSLSEAQEGLSAAIGDLKAAEAGLEAPGTGIAGQPHQTIESIAEVSGALNELLRRVDAAQAELPPIREPNSSPSSQELARVRLNDVPAETQAELDGSVPQFLSTTTSHACKIGPFQFRRLRNGDIYKGRYARSKKCGDGAYMFVNGDIYEGEFEDDHMQGHGVYQFSGQGRYEGGWQAARYSGHGAETFAKGSTYCGEYQAGSRAGYGVCRYYNGDYYEGTWAEGVRSGAGMQQCMDGSNYVGEYRDAKREGHGVYTFHNGDCYLGTYQADLPNGIGVYLFEKGQKYMGEWAHGKKHGMCEYIVESGERYVGEWEDGKPKWVQSLGGGAEERSKLSEDMQAKVATALEIAEQARRAAERSQNLAAEHWDVQSKAQTMVVRAVELADDASVRAQQARARAMVLSHKLDVLVQRHVGDAGWPTTDEPPH